MGQTTSQIDLHSSDNRLGHNESGLEDLTQEESMRYDTFAEASQWLQEAPPIENLAVSMEEAPGELPTPSIKDHEHGLTLLQRASRMATTSHPLQSKSIVIFGNILSSRSRSLHSRNRNEGSLSGMYMISPEALGSKKLRLGYMW